jgi:hypothetical protein
MPKPPQVVSLLVFCLIGVVSANAGPVLEFNSNGPGIGVDTFTGTEFYFGWSFETNNTVTVTALDAYDPTGTGLVDLYNVSGTILASANVTTNDPQDGSPTPFYSQAIDPITLQADTTYYIVQQVCGLGDCPDSPTTFFEAATDGFTVDPSITYGAGVSGDLDGLPTTDFYESDNPSYFGPNFEEATAPEPSTLAMGLSAALLGLAGLRRRSARWYREFARILYETADLITRKPGLLPEGLSYRRNPLTGQTFLQADFETAIGFSTHLLRATSGSWREHG